MVRGVHQGHPGGYGGLEAFEARATWSVRIAPAVREIYAYWLPYRRAVQAIPENAIRH